MRIRPMVALASTAALLAALTLPGPASAASEPTPTEPPGKLAAALTCNGNLAEKSGPAPVLLVPGTTQTAQSQFSWNFMPALTRAGVAWCAVSPPANQMGDIQTAAEYVAYAIKTMYKAAGRKINVVGHSQGGMQPRWVLKFWPSTRAMVEDLIGIAPANQGVSTLPTTCLPILGCPPAFWQYKRGSKFLAALNGGPQTFPGISYSVLYSKSDEVVLPQDTPLAPAPGTAYRRVALQEVCALNVAEHVLNGSVDPVVWALVMDALTHDGAVDPARITRSVCTQLVMPGVSLDTVAAGVAGAVLAVALYPVYTPLVPAEPRLRCYATETC